MHIQLTPKQAKILTGARPATQLEFVYSKSTSMMRAQVQELLAIYLNTTQTLIDKLEGAISEQNSRPAYVPHIENKRLICLYRRSGMQELHAKSNCLPRKKYGLK